jgi:two-component system NtrC family sensor kinase
MPELIRILCVDDEIKILNVVRRQLFDEAFEVLTALTTEEAFEILRTVRPIHVVLSDYRMPGMNGLEFLGKVAEEWPAVAGIIISGYADVPAVQQALEKNGLFQFIAKPWKAGEMRKAVAGAAALSLARLAGNSPACAAGRQPGAVSP